MKNKKLQQKLFLAKLFIKEYSQYHADNDDDVGGYEYFAFASAKLKYMLILL